MIRALPLIVGLAPFFGISAAYWLNANAGTLPSCFPYLEGCTSISSTGRYEPGSLIFRAVMFPQAVLLAVLWWISRGWLDALPRENTWRRAMLFSGLAGAIALIIYVTFLGTTQPFYEFMRRFGTWFYFAGTVFAQIFLSLSLSPSRLRNAMMVLISVPFVLGLLNLIQKAVFVDPYNIENRIEWIASLMMQLWFILLYFAWRRSGIVVTVRTDSTTAH